MTRVEQCYVVMDRRTNDAFPVAVFTNDLKGKMEAIRLTQEMAHEYRDVVAERGPDGVPLFGVDLERSITGLPFIEPGMPVSVRMLLLDDRTLWLVKEINVGRSGGIGASC